MTEIKEQNLSQHISHKINIVYKSHSWYAYMVVLVPVTGLTSARAAQITLRSPGIQWQSFYDQY